MKKEELDSLYQAMRDGGFGFLQLEKNFEKVTMIRNNSEFTVSESPSREEHPEKTPESEVQVSEKMHKIFSEHVGVFSFGKKKPAEGMPVKSGELLGLIKGISHHDNVTASSSGKLSSVRVAEGEIVDFGHLLFEITD
ncbi:MAG: hypothetical protein HQM10_01250 [Candidatus Riflebacteria bacterium]|nr:hypothetical protein [Candidatus Riflebacteria bacterium]